MRKSWKCMARALAIGLCATTLTIGCGTESDDDNTGGNAATTGTVTGTISYAGSSAGALLVGAHTSTTLMGPPTFSNSRVENVTFPVDYSLTVDLNQDLYVFALFDVGNNNPTIPGSEDPMLFHDTVLKLTADAPTVTRDITLVDP